MAPLSPSFSFYPYITNLMIELLLSLEIGMSKLLLPGFSDEKDMFRIQFQKPKSYLWNPQEDITTYELALAIPLLVNLHVVPLANLTVEEILNTLPENVRRHFKEIKEEGDDKTV